MSVFPYQTNITEVGPPVNGRPSWLSSEVEREDGFETIRLSAWDGHSRTDLNATPDEAFRYALSILRDVSLARFGSG